MRKLLGSPLPLPRDDALDARQDGLESAPQSFRCHLEGVEEWSDDVLGPLLVSFKRTADNGDKK